MTAAVNDPVMERNIIQFREGTRGRKFSPKPRYFHMGLGGFDCAAAFASTFTSTLEAEAGFYDRVSESSLDQS